MMRTITSQHAEVSYQNICDDLSIGELVNTDDNTFWWLGKELDREDDEESDYDLERGEKFQKRYKHESGKVGDRFRDGNNGDIWRVVAINTKFNRIVVENLTQGGMKLAYWN